MISELQKVLSTLDIAADWVGLRAVKETTGYRSMRDGLPQDNGKSAKQGVMVEVLVNGQIGYGAVNSFQGDRIQIAAEMAYQQAVAASQWAIYPMTTSARPKVVGQYTSPFLKPLDALSAGDINDLLLRLCQTLKVSDHIVQTNATVVNDEVESWFVSSNGSEVYQKFLTSKLILV
jgi:predicted Zn-dependent protease